MLPNKNVWGGGGERISFNQRLTKDKTPQTNKKLIER